MKRKFTVHPSSYVKASSADSRLKYFDVYFEIDHENKTGYSVFVEAYDENDALAIVIDEHLYEEPEDLDDLKAITEITRDEYLASL